MSFAEFFPVWSQLTQQEQAALTGASTRRSVPKGTLLHNGSADCVGLMLICSGQLRTYILSEDGKEVTLYRLFERDICLFSASCMMPSIQFDVMITAEKDTDLWVIPADIYKSISEHSAPLANYTNELMAARFSEVMWLIEQIMWKSFDRRLAAFLLEESALDGTAILKITHDKIAAHMGTAREVVTRMLRYFQAEGMVQLNRGSVELTDEKRLRALSK